MRALGLATAALFLASLGMAAPAVGAAPVTLKVSMWINDTRVLTKTQALLPEYEKTHPNVKIDLIQQPWDGYHDKLIALTASGLTPDVMVLSRGYLPSFASRGIVQPIDDLLKSEKRFDVHRDVAGLDSGVYNGHIYGIPIWGGVNEHRSRDVALDRLASVARERFASVATSNVALPAGSALFGASHARCCRPPSRPTQ